MTRQETCLFFKFLLILAIRELGMKHGTLASLKNVYKIRNFPFIQRYLISSFVKLTNKKLITETKSRKNKTIVVHVIIGK